MLRPGLTCILVAHVCVWSACGELFDFDGDGLSDEQVPVVDIPSCQEVADWPAAWTEFEEQVLVLTNQARAAGHDCDTAGRFGPTGPLVMNERLRCAARVHSHYMSQTGHFDHVQPQNGSDPFDRIETAGYRFSSAGENIAVGQSSPAEVVAGWLESDGHCENIMSPDFSELGVGFAIGTGTPIGSAEAAYWTQAFGRPL
jgi:uncharacterized protein YkwD